MEVSWKLVKGEVRQQLMHQGDQKLFQVVLLLLLAPALISCSVAEYPTDCSQINEIGDHQPSGLYSIYPTGEKLRVEVYCQMSPDQPAWTVIQTRKDGTVNFYRPWIQYKVGFGSVGGEHWLGLDNLHYLTSGPTKFELQVDMEDFEGNKTSAHYRRFSVDSECNGYTLTVSGFTDKGAGDSMTSHNGMKFSTFDRDQDTWSENCASNFMGGFWYHSCYQANPNGVYRWGQEKTPFAVGVIWYTWKKTNDYSLKSIVMKVRPVQPE
ncbi:microfibril-associated glycoprotein 4-like isoform X1 [Platichthys flesus]|uniref:microfibril-associated glycoprotein 4-like isoform X1 n=1 Tax=Platichthys flesus TaxID=8260 RepID=UPI002DBEA1F0|nr:microfibril-associated glycoprotein 4-like isoform X1 [Platichthys flesus]XP_062235275.1 microfibril-associated glycoprotein 4-like isoform X1 [Platichthys flesus]